MRRWYHYPLGLAAWPLTWPWLVGKVAVLVLGSLALALWWRR
jgi:hypothetical protein